MYNGFESELCAQCSQAVQGYTTRTDSPEESGSSRYCHCQGKTQKQTAWPCVPGYCLQVHWLMTPQHPRSNVLATGLHRMTVAGHPTLPACLRHTPVAVTAPNRQLLKLPRCFSLSEDGRPPRQEMKTALLLGCFRLGIGYLVCIA